MAKAYTIGIDYGTNSVRALVVRCADGAELGSCVVDYPSGHQGVLLEMAQKMLSWRLVQQEHVLTNLHNGPNGVEDRRVRRAD